MGGRKVWFDQDVKRLNYDQQGTFLGEFNNDDQILVILENGDYYLTNFDLNNHFEDNLWRIEKYQPQKIWTAALFDADQNGYLYLKRFPMDATLRHQNFVGENPQSRLVILTDVVYPRIKVTMGGNDDFRDPMEIEAEEFIGVKSFKARGKRVTTLCVAKVEELEPTRFPEESEEDKEPNDNGPENGTPEEPDLDPDAGKSQQDVADEMTGQLHLFD